MDSLRLLNHTDRTLHTIDLFVDHLLCSDLRLWFWTFDTQRPVYDSGIPGCDSGLQHSEHLCLFRCRGFFRNFLDFNRWWYGDDFLYRSQRRESIPLIANLVVRIRGG